MASGSPRRLELLSVYDVDIDVMTSDLDEVINQNEKPENVVMSLALQKALDVASKVDDSEIIIGADTIVYNGQILGKPNNEKDAFEMLKSLSGKTHSVMTGIAIVQKSSNKKVIDYEETIVEFKNLDEDTIKKYLTYNEYEDKAGSYAIQGLSALFIEKIDGSYQNVVGLPVAKLNDLLHKHFHLNLL